MKVWYRFAACITAVSLLSSPAIGVLAQEEEEQQQKEEKQEITLTYIQEEEEEEEETRVEVVELDEGEAPEYWLGVMGEPVSDVLKSHLKVEGGLIITTVVPESPAGKAGLQAHDILLRFGDNEVSELGSLMEALRGANGAETDVLILRGGEKTRVAIAPQKRPEDHGHFYRRHIELLQQHPLGEVIVGGDPQRLNLLTVRPGIVLDAPVEFPKNTSISIHKTDEGPAKIDVKQGDKSWSVTEEKLDELPEDIRAAIRQMLSGGPRHVHAHAYAQAVPTELPKRVRLHLDTLRKTESSAAPARVRVLPGQGDLGQKIDALIEKLDRLEKEVQSLKEQEAK